MKPHSDNEKEINFYRGVHPIRIKDEIISKDSNIWFEAKVNEKKYDVAIIVRGNEKIVVVSSDGKCFKVELLDVVKMLLERNC